MKKQYVYILKCADGSLYTGWTTDLANRLEVHNSGKGAKYTKTRRPVRMVYHEEYDDKSTAMSREYAIKQLTRGEKERLIRDGRGTIYLAADAEPELDENLRNMGFNICHVKTEGIVDGPVSNHPDMFMCKLGLANRSPIIRCENPCSELASKYPGDIAYNAACTGKYFIHNLKYTSPKLLDAAKNYRHPQTKEELIFVNTKQGYAKCSTVIVDEDSIITYDRGLASSCEEAGMKPENILLVEPGHVELPGYNTGFIGGTSGRIDKTIYFNGNLSEHPDFERIVEFIEARKLRVKWFEDWPLKDIGSIISDEI